MPIVTPLAWAFVSAGVMPMPVPVEPEVPTDVTVASSLSAPLAKSIDSVSPTVNGVVLATLMFVAPTAVAADVVVVVVCSPSE